MSEANYESNVVIRNVEVASSTGNRTKAELLNVVEEEGASLFYATRK